MKTLLAVLFLLAACELPQIPLPGSSPTPSPTVAPSPSASPGPQACLPKPPPLCKLQPVIHNRPNPGKVVLDVTPKVCDAAYCTQVGFEGRNECPVRLEGDPLGGICNKLVVGGDPVWRSVSGGTYKAHPSNPYLAFYFGNGVAEVCSKSEPKVCGTVSVTDN